MGWLLKNLFTPSREFLADAFFPLFCLGCEAPGTWLCSRCSAALPKRLEQRCPLCLKQTTPRGERCFACRDMTGLDGMYAASHYDSPLLSYILHTYKYRFMKELGEVLGSFLVKALRSTDLPLPDLILSVPLHARRLRFRGFNQSELLARHVGEHLAPGFPIPVESGVLVRTRKTKPQMETRSRDERLRNLSGAFAIIPGRKKMLSGKRLWLVDDVSTTGTTLSECAKVLKNAGTRSVFGIVIAR